MSNTGKLKVDLKKQIIAAIILLSLGAPLTIVSIFLFKVNDIAFYLTFIFGIAFLISGFVIFFAGRYYQENKEKALVDERITIINDKAYAAVGRLLQIIFSVQFLVFVLYIGICSFAEIEINYKVGMVLGAVFIYIDIMVLNAGYIIARKHYMKKF